MEQKEFRSVGKRYRKIAGKRFRLPRKAKKRFKTNMCKHGWSTKKTKIQLQKTEYGWLRKRKPHLFRI